jgi:seryl-tRNA synthetase
MATKKTTTTVTTTQQAETTQVRSREPLSLDAVFDKVVTMGEAKVKLEEELKELRATLQEAIKPLGGEYIRNGMKAMIIAEVNKPKGRLVSLAEVLKAVPKRYHSLILVDKFTREQLRMNPIKENNVKVTIN